jgi:hypothetical protein
MNEKIKELAETALKSSMVHDGVYRPEGYANSVSKEFADKFAELIIQECAEVINKDIMYQVEQGVMSNVFGLNQARELIKHHFGIEE